MNKMIIGILAALVVPMVTAAPNAQTGEQTGMFWGESTAVAAQGGTSFVLLGIVGDHDVFFYNAAGQQVGGFLACGADQGTVPASAVTAVIRVWDHEGGVVPQCLASGASGLPSSTFVYVDGL